MVVITAKDITFEDRMRLDGSVQQILQKGSYRRDELLSRIRDLISPGSPDAVQAAKE